MNEAPEVSVIIPILEACEGFEALNAAYLQQLSRLVEPCEIIYVLDYRDDVISDVVSKMVAALAHAKSITLSRYFGDSTALRTGIQASVGERILVLPAYHQVEPADVLQVLARLDGCDMAVGERDRSGESFLNRLQGRIFNQILATAASSVVRDMGCDVRAFRRRVLDDVPIYGDQHRFLPVLAHRVGFDVQSVAVRQSVENRKRRMRSPADYVRSVLDILNVVFLTRFTKKPLRFFGLVGMTLSAFGTAVILYVVVERLFFDVPLASRPALVMGALMLVVGLQIMGIGLIGEIVIFSRARDLPEYYVKEVVEQPRPESTNSAGATHHDAQDAGDNPRSVNNGASGPGRGG